MKSIVAAVFAVAAFVSAPAATADDMPDPHVPNGDALWCLGGRGNVALAPYCNGTPYADGSYWHQVADVPMFGLTWHPAECVLPGGDPAPAGCR